ncbi:hypothetical protein [Halorubrum vacuolatum]|uniref:Uncharacterized protein n=1 Tax=Halorubrum vacuolatum TaxID=63740 RepID=A0A238Y8S5_HALVU|nr:hypothetical protein [Halorubrum vacuolatum]SNR67635.1 hypothetical protein SAMN06264855_1348 [Halorubrum vacuolatum]
MDLEENESQLCVAGGNIVYYPDSVSEGIDFLRAFNTHISYRHIPYQNGFYGEYTGDDWTVTIKEDVNKDTDYIAVVNGQQERFEDALDMRTTIRNEVLKQITVAV